MHGVKAALEAIDAAKPDGEINGLVLPIKDATLDDALRAAKDRTLAFDNATKPISQKIEQLEGQSPSRDFIAARLRLRCAPV